MNANFIKLLKEKGWEQKKMPANYTARASNVYIKTFSVKRNVNEAELRIPIDVYFMGLNDQQLPKAAVFSNILMPATAVSSNNLNTHLKGRDRIICMFDEAGYETALKFAIYSNPVSYFKDKAKKLLYDSTTF